MWSLAAGAEKAVRALERTVLLAGLEVMEDEA